MTPQARSLNNTTLAGVIGAVGLIIQIIIGFALAGSGNPTGSALILPHMLIGIAGIALVAFLVSSIFLNASSTMPTLIYALAFVLTLAQVALGFRELSAPDQMLLMTHEGLAIVILVLLGLGGMLTARSRRQSVTAAPGAPGQHPVA
jgi:FtsH-binding integral membrane protein